MLEPYYWYVLYVRTGAESRVVSELAQYAELHGYPKTEVDPFCPESESYYRASRPRTPGKTYRRRPLFPSYVFVETRLDAGEFLTQFGSYIYSSRDVIRILKSGDSTNIALPREERIRLEYLLMGKRCVEHSVGYIVGDKITVMAGPLRGAEGLIVYVNRHNRYADIEVDMFGGRTKARVALEIVEKHAQGEEITNRANNNA